MYTDGTKKELTLVILKHCVVRKIGQQTQTDNRQRSTRPHQFQPGTIGAKFPVSLTELFLHIGTGTKV